MSLGKEIRLKRILRNDSHHTVIIPMDHGVTTATPKGLQHIPQTVYDVANGGADAILVHKGCVPHIYHSLTREIALIVHLSASTDIGTSSNDKVLVATVEEALKLGADAVSIHINLGNKYEASMLSDLGKISTKCDDWGMPLLAMIYARNDNSIEDTSPKTISHCARIGAELGADIIKVAYTGSPDSFCEVTENCPVPVVIAGGEEKFSTEALLCRAYDALQAGAAGVSMGRAVFEHPHRTAIVQALCSIIHQGFTVQKAFELFTKLSTDNR